MRRSWMLLAAAAIALTASQVASAADLPRRAPPAPAYMPPPPPAFVWTGCYIGGNVGGAWNRIEVEDVTDGISVSRTNSGFAGGGQIGCDYQMAAWVFGIRNMFDATSLNKHVTVDEFGDTLESKTRWFDTLTGRAGYLVQPNLLFYAQGGAAWAKTTLTLTDIDGFQFGEISRNKTGWTAGGGVEWMFVPHWSVFLEYNFMGFGTFSNAVTGCVFGTCATLSGKANIQDVLVGVNYRF
jgi:outer membrane immunogenic protein